MRQIPFGLKQEENCQFNEGQLKNELSSSDLVMLDNPHIPTIQGFPRKTLLSLIDDNPQNCLMMDESYLAFVDLDSSNSLVPTIRPNLIALKTVTMSHGWLGLGPNYFAGSNLDRHSFLARRFSPTLVLGWAQQTGLELVHQEPIVQREEIADFRHEILPQLQCHSHLNIIPCNAPYNLLQVTSELFATLKKQHSAIDLTMSWGEHYSGLTDNHLNIALWHHEGLQRFLSVLKQLEY